MVVCTKLVQWLCGGGLILVVWYSLLSELLPLKLSPELQEVVTPFPIYLVICYGCYSLAVIGCRLITFNDCDQAADDLHKEIKAAKMDLAAKGLKI